LVQEFVIEQFELLVQSAWHLQEVE